MKTKIVEVRVLEAGNYILDKEINGIVHVRGIEQDDLHKEGLVLIVHMVRNPSEFRDSFLISGGYEECFNNTELMATRIFRDKSDLVARVDFL